MLTSLFLYVSILVSSGHSRRTQTTISYNDFVEEYPSNEYPDSSNIAVSGDDVITAEDLQIYGNLDDSPGLVQNRGDKNATLIFYHNTFESFTELNFKDVTKIFSTDWYDSEKSTIIFTYGFTGRRTGPAVTAVINAYLDKREENVVLLNWERMAAAELSNFANSYFNYASPNSIMLGNEFAEILVKLSEAGLDLNKTHLIGHSLGAHIFGIAGNKLVEKGIQLPWITGLDPARAGFDRKPPSTRINPGSARFVAVIHSDPQKYGSRKELGFVDFWPNFRSGPQPGCSNQSYPRFSPEDLCNHHRCWRLLLDAIKHPGKLLGSWAKNYRTWKNYSEKERNAVVLELGVFNPKAARGSYYFTTTAESPYGLGKNGL